MKHVKLKIALLSAAAVTFGLALVGCGPSNAKYDYKVTFDYNISVWQCEDEECGEVFFDMEKPEVCPKCGSEEGKGVTLKEDNVGIKNSNKYLQYLGAYDNSLVVKYPDDVNPDQHLPLQTIEGYAFDGWYLPQTENGEVVVGEDGRVVTGEKVDFATYRVKSDVTFYARFAKKKTLTVLGRTEQGEELTLSREIVYSGAMGGVFNEPLEGLVAEVAGYSLVEYYKDESLTEIFPFPYTFGEEDETVYAKFLEGTWAAVTSPTNTAGSSEVINGFNNAIQRNMNIYLRGDLDYAGVTWPTSNSTRSYSGIIRGNGYKISNISVTRTASRNDEFSIFGDIADGFEVHDLSFEDVSLNVTFVLGGIYPVSGFAKSISPNAVFDKFSYSCVVNIEKEGRGTSAIVQTSPICPEPPETLDESMFKVTINGND
ncbi:MAG: hypothetical protein K2G44_01750 [Clostridia bacterium]|nr:hypothetical protein [Clostridia bacterium]